jgi:hypothetical protein
VVIVAGVVDTDRVSNYGNVRTTNRQRVYITWCPVTFVSHEYNVVLNMAVYWHLNIDEVALVLFTVQYPLQASFKSRTVSGGE